MKKNKIIYWITTGLVSVGFLLSSLLYLMQSPELMENFKTLGIPFYMVQLLGVAKLLGGIAIINPWYAKLREWAYAGYTFVLVGATWTHLSTQTPFIAPLFFLALLAVSYIYSKKVTVQN
jgi:hypothetical protein